MKKGSITSFVKLLKYTYTYVDNYYTCIFIVKETELCNETNNCLIKRKISDSKG